MVPLGLGLPVHRVPIITITIVITCTLKYFLNDIDLNKNLESKIKHVQTKVEKTEAYRNLKYNFCLKNSLKELDCKKFSERAPVKSDKKKPEFLKWVMLENKFLTALRKESTEVTELQSFNAYKKMWQTHQNELINYYSERNLLTDKTLTIENSLICMFTHLNLVHLMGNMLALLAFGIYVEARIGPLFMGLSYLACGFVSFFGYINYFSPGTIPLIGASGAIAGTMGMFYLYFNRHYLKFWVHFKTFLLPVKTYFPFIYVMNDVLTHIEATSNVAAMAHIIGMFTGVVMVIMSQKLFKLPHPFIYREEYEFYSSIKKKSIKPKELSKLSYWLKRNPINFVLREKLIHSMWNGLPADEKYSTATFETLRINTRKAIGRALFFKEGKSIIKTLDLIPLHYSLSPFLDDFKNEELATLYNFCLKRGATVSAVRLACSLLDRQKDEDLNQTLIENICASSAELDQASFNTILDQCKNKYSILEYMKLDSGLSKETA